MHTKLRTVCLQDGGGEEIKELGEEKHGSEERSQQHVVRPILSGYHLTTVIMDSNPH